MTDREKLIELIAGVHYGNENASMMGNNFQRGFIEKIADHLIDNGVTVRKKEKTVKFLPCKCGKNSHIEWYNQGGSVSYECKYCGLKSPAGRSVNEARKLWNEMICSAERSEEREG